MAILLSFATLALNAPTASAMTLADLQGDYRVVDVQGYSTMYGSAKGSVIAFSIENEDFIGKIKKKGQTCSSDVGEAVVYNVFIDRGLVNCNITPCAGYGADCIMVVYNNGETLRLVDKNDYDNGQANQYIWELRRI
ncbi:MAG: hypothetical protein IJS96_03045 [Schwartzia sp.]|nr:hypothetical protein [Schwartzia sp. (in: firmicutes)]